MRLTQLDRPYRNIDSHPSPDMRTKWTVVGLAGVPKAPNERALVLCFQPIPSEGENRWMQEPSSFCPAEPSPGRGGSLRLAGQLDRSFTRVTVP